MKKFFAFALSLVMILGIASGCGAKDAPADSDTKTENGQTEGKALKVGVALPTAQEEAWVEVESVLTDLCNERGYEVTIQSANGDSERQYAQVQSLLTTGIDILLLAAVDPATNASLVEEAHADGTVVVAMERVSEQCNYDAGVVYNYYSYGTKSAQWLGNVCPKGNVVWLGGDVAAVEAAQDYEDGLVEELKNWPELNLVVQQNCKDWAASEGMLHTENALTAYNNDIQAIICANDTIASGAIQAVEDAGLTGKVIVTGGDCETAALQRIAAGTQAMSIYKDYAKFCELALDTAVSLYNGENVDLEVYYGVPSVKCEYSTIDSTNLDQEFIDSGKRTHEEIYGQ